MATSTLHYVLPILTVIAPLAAANAAGQPTCAEFGKPTYSADRTIQSAGGEKTVMFDMKRRAGIWFPAPPVGSTSKLKDDPNFNVEKATAADRTTLAFNARQDGKWTRVMTIVCRNDGVELERDFTLLVNNKVVPAKFVHTNIVVKALPPETFAVPPDVKLEEAKPPK
jgi:hypothetical protein